MQKKMAGEKTSYSRSKYIFKSGKKISHAFVSLLV